MKTTRRFEIVPGENRRADFDRHQTVTVISVPAPEAKFCPYCDRRMSVVESNEQHACNDCYGGRWKPPLKPDSIRTVPGSVLRGLAAEIELNLNDVEIYSMTPVGINLLLQRILALLKAEEQQ